MANVGCPAKAVALEILAVGSLCVFPKILPKNNPATWYTQVSTAKSEYLFLKQNNNLTWLVLSRPRSTFFFFMMSEVFISQIHEIYPSHRWIHMGLWVVGQKTSVGSQQWCASNDPMATGESRENVFWESHLLPSCARMSNLPQANVDMQWHCMSSNNEHNMWHFSSEIKHQTTHLNPLQHATATGHQEIWWFD